MQLLSARCVLLGIFIKAVHSVMCCVPSGSRRGHGGAARGSTEPPCSQGCPSIPEGARPALVHTLLLKPRSPKAEENCPPPGDTSTGWQCWEAAGGSTVPGTVRPCRSSAPWIPRLMPELSHLSSSSLPTVPRTGRTSSISDKGLGLWVLPEAAV